MELDVVHHERDDVQLLADEPGGIVYVTGHPLCSFATDPVLSAWGSSADVAVLSCENRGVGQSEVVGCGFSWATVLPRLFWHVIKLDVWGRWAWSGVDGA
ncbi:hypothetical protein [Streptosporangium sp. NPDC003464]